MGESMSSRSVGVIDRGLGSDTGWRVGVSEFHHFGSGCQFVDVSTGLQVEENLLTLVNVGFTNRVQRGEVSQFGARLRPVYVCFNLHDCRITF